MYKVTVDQQCCMGGDSGTDRKAGGGDVTIFIRRDRTGGTVWRENTRGETEVART